MLTIAITVVFVLVLMNGVFAMSEMAVVSSNRTRLRIKADNGNHGAAAALKISEHPTRFLSAVQVGITLIGIFAGAFGQATIAGELTVMLQGVPAVAAYSQAIATGIVVVLLTYVSLVLGELAPKRIALTNPEGIASVVAGPFGILAKIMAPFVSLLSFSTAGVLKLFRIRDRDGSGITHDEVAAVLSEGTGAGVIEPEEQDMIHEILRLGDRPVRVAMTPRVEVYSVSIDDDEEAIRDAIRACPYSRLVAVRDHKLDKPVGVIHKRDVADALLAGGPLNLEAITSPPRFVPETTRLLKLFELFRDTPSHMAFVVDEYGGLEGIVTPGDLLEIISGELPEPHDTPDEMVIERADGTVLVDGQIDLVDLGDRLKHTFKERNSFHTLGGLILHELGRFPSEGEVVHIDHYEIEIVDMDDRRIDKVILRERSNAD